MRLLLAAALLLSPSGCPAAADPPGVTGYRIDYQLEGGGEYVVDVWTVPGNFVNTGLAYNPIDHTLFSSHWNGGGQGESIEELHRWDGARAAPPIALGGIATGPQGLTYDRADDTLWVWGTQAPLPAAHASHVSREGALLSDGFTMPGNPGSLELEAPGGRIWSKSNWTPAVEVYDRTGAVVDQFGTLYGGEGISGDPFDETFWVLTESSLHHLQRVGSSSQLLGSWPNPSHHWPPDVQLGYTVSGAAEGLVVDPSDRTLWFNADQGYHGNVPGGNRCWHLDPLGTHDRFVLMPGGVRWEKGVFDGTRVDGAALVLAAGEPLGRYTSAVVDLGDRPAIADELELRGEVDVLLEYRGSDAAPTTIANTRLTRPYHDARQANEGWGATPPGAWSSLLPATRFVQVRFTLVLVNDAAPASGFRRDDR